MDDELEMEEPTIEDLKRLVEIWHNKAAEQGVRAEKAEKEVKALRERLKMAKEEAVQDLYWGIRGAIEKAYRNAIIPG